jgi:glycosyltransferase involved in cell wall biosynthesis
MKSILKTLNRRILVDAREFTPGRLTGIGRVLEGLVDALTESNSVENIILAISELNAIPLKLRARKKIEPREVSASFLKSEMALSDLSKDDIRLFISPYPKLPLFGTYCPKINMIHDVLDLTHPAYRKRIRVLFDGYRLRKALRAADRTWYVSSWSLEETRKYAGFIGENPKVRYNGIDETFTPIKKENEDEILDKNKLRPGYVLALGNGLPHKNLAVILEIANQFKRDIVFAGVMMKNQTHWKSRYPEARPTWITHVKQEELPPIIRGAFCLVQPSTEEGYGYPPLESMACGIPTIVSDIPVLRETTGGNALLADPMNPSAWLDAIRSLEKPDHYKLLVHKGLNWVGRYKGRSAWAKHISDIEEMMSKGQRE